jgi:hypothetical protein
VVVVIDASSLRLLVAAGADGLNDLAVLTGCHYHCVPLGICVPTTDGSRADPQRGQSSSRRVSQQCLGVVRNIVLDHAGEESIGICGDLILLMPWEFDEAGLPPIAFDYNTEI